MFPLHMFIYDVVTPRKTECFSTSGEIQTTNKERILSFFHVLWSAGLMKTSRTAMSTDEGQLDGRRTLTDNGVNKTHEGSHLHLQPRWPNNTQSRRHTCTHTNTLAGGVVVWVLHQSICCPVRRWTREGGGDLRGSAPSIAHVHQQGVECVCWLGGKPCTETWILTRVPLTLPTCDFGSVWPSSSTFLNRWCLVQPSISHKLGYL